MGCLDDGCNTGLVLGLGLNPSPPSNLEPSSPSKINNNNNIIKPITTFDPSLLTLGLHPTHHHKKGSSGDQEETVGLPVVVVCGDVYRPASPHSVVSSFSSGRVKRERDISSEETTEVERVSSRASDEEEDGGNNARKKLRLTKEQSALLEESFKQHSTLNPKQKQALARQLSLRPRQVEVWFQNRRARTKLKQTEVDCEFLKKCCETLTDENRRLQKELQELKALKMAHPFYMHMPAATLTMCPSCERIGGGGGGDGGASKGGALISMAHQKSHFFNPFANPSAAC